MIVWVNGPFGAGKQDPRFGSFLDGESTPAATLADEILRQVALEHDLGVGLTNPT